MNEDRFTGRADLYAKYRPSYPDDFIEYLYSQVGLTKDSIIADIGSGTGIFTRLMLRQHSFVYGVEPNEDMRKTAESELARYRNFVSIHAPAERTGLKTASIDFVTVAQAFHWFDREKFRMECKRIVREKGKVILVWNSRGNESELTRETIEINRKYCPGFEGFSGGMREPNPEQYGDFFKGGTCEYKVFNNDSILDEASFIGRNLSASYAPKQGTEGYQPYIFDLTRLFQKYSKSGYLCVPSLTRSYVGEV